VSTYEDLYGPAEPTWIAAVHESEKDYKPLGTAVVVDSYRLLTCAHVVLDSSLEEPEVRTEIWAAFPKVTLGRRRVKKVEFAYEPPVKDFAVLILDDPVPPAVMAAPLQCVAPDKLKSKRWWAFGFPGRDPIGNSAGGIVGEALVYGWVHLDTSSRYLLQIGFSGGGMWSADFRAVVGLVGQAHSNGDGRAITLHQANEYFPEQKLSELANGQRLEEGVTDASNNQ
jgi:Trypsin-like peptidase domain